ncbi:Na(+)-translocating NADH-quinone reductase subunit A [Flavobacteriaceae bacterium]|nr:Na(+)-translocating NADH-quinone reductase subunit A [Flavobacteriaceae bacterium]
MSRDIKIKKGLNINLKGEAEKTLSKAPRAKVFALRPENFHLVTPKLTVKEGAKIKAGEVLFYDKNQESVTFVSPVSGTLKSVERGPKRVITQLTIEADVKDEFLAHQPFDVEKADAEAIKAHLLASGCWPFIMQRPYDIIARTNKTPKAIFISGYTTAPLAADLDFALIGKEDDLQLAITALSKLTPGSVHVGVGQHSNSPLRSMKDCIVHNVSGPHPAGNVGVQITQINPVNKGEVVWTVSAQDLVVIGELLRTGKFNAERVVALAGSSLGAPQYYTAKIGSAVAPLIQEAQLAEAHSRVISGDVLTGGTIGHDGYMGYYDNTICVIPEGDDYEFFGWNKPVFDKVSTTRALTFSWLQPKKKYDLTTNTNGEHRAFVVTGNYEEVFPMDIYPLQTLKACMVKDLDQMEALGMYELAPEDFALTEFVCVSKQPHQRIIREGLDLMFNEIG